MCEVPGTFRAGLARRSPRGSRGEREEGTRGDRNLAHNCLTEPGTPGSRGPCTSPIAPQAAALMSRLRLGGAEAPPAGGCTRGLHHHPRVTSALCGGQERRRTGRGGGAGTQGHPPRPRLWRRPGQGDLALLSRTMGPPDGPAGVLRSMCGCGAHMHTRVRAVYEGVCVPGQVCTDEALWGEGERVHTCSVSGSLACTCVHVHVWVCSCQEFVCSCQEEGFRRCQL